MTNQDLLAIAKEFGTPVYVYDVNSIREQYEKLTSSFSKNTRFFYAAKALTNINILKYVEKLGASLDCVSINEVKLGLKAGFSNDRILFTPNCVDLAEIEEAMSLNVHINIDNISILEQFGNKFGSSYPIFVRINPHIFAGGNYKISTGHIDSKFGISIHQLPHIKRVVENTGLHLDGVHMHTGSDILDIDVFLQGAEILFEVAAEFKNLSYIDFGSGFKVPYYPGADETDIEYLGERLSARFNEFEKGYGKPLTLMFEPGKYMVSEAGSFLATVNVVKQTTSTVFAGIDTGFNHLIRPMFYSAHHEIENISNPEGRSRYYTVVGYICETDTFGSNRKINEISEGDVLCFHNAGAYCFSMASNYNSRFKPAEVLLIDDKDYLIRRRETIQDLIATTEDIKF